jgi:hypothetical protein
VSAGSFSNAFHKLQEEHLQHNVHDMPAAMADMEEAEQVVHQLTDIAMHSKLQHLIVIKEKMQESGAALSMFFFGMSNVLQVHDAASDRASLEAMKEKKDCSAARLAFRENPVQIQPVDTNLAFVAGQSELKQKKLLRFRQEVDLAVFRHDMAISHLPKRTEKDMSSILKKKASILMATEAAAGRRSVAELDDKRLLDPVSLNRHMLFDPLGPNSHGVSYVRGDDY